MSIQSIRGINDVLPDETTTWNHIERTARNLFEDFGLLEIRIPILEKTLLFSRSIGESTDIVEKEMYSFEDKGREQVTLRPEGTASVVRAYIQHRLYHPPSLVKLYYLGPMFRYERPQAGRYRQFYQIGVEAFGVNDPALDAEILSMLVELFRRLGVEGVRLQLNTIGCSLCRPHFRAALQGYLEDGLAELCPDCRRRSSQNPLRTLDCKQEGCRQKLIHAPEIADFLCPACIRHFQRVQEMLSALAIPFQVNPRMVRGLDYYTRTTFELTSDLLGAQDAVAGGGRYDGLVEAMGGPPTPAIGFALGMERLVALLNHLGKTPLRSGPLAFVATLGDQAERKAFELLGSLRKAGITAERDYANPSLKSQLRKANRLQAHYAILIGEEELSNGKASIRNMSSKEQIQVPFDQVASWIKP